MAGGRPKNIPDIAEVERLAGLGLTQEQIAHNLGIGLSTLYKRKSEMKEFVEAIERGKANAINQVANRLFEKAMDGDNVAMIYFMKCRDPQQWNERVIEKKHGVEPDQKIIINTGGPDGAGKSSD